MNKIIGAGAALLLSTGLVSAGGLDRSGQPIGLIFEEGNVGQISLGFVTPNVSGTATGQGLTGESGSMASSYVQLGFGYKHDLTDQLSLALIYDQPYGAAVDYGNASGGYYATGSEADVNAWSLNAVARYRINDGFSVHGGVRFQTVNADVTKPAGPADLYNITTEDSTAWGYLVGAAYERPDIALRIALTYYSAVDHDIRGVESTTVGGANPAATSPVTTPQAVNLDFQTGIAADTLLFGTIRWTEWTAFDFAPALHEGIYSSSLQDYDHDVWTYSVGVGRRFSDQWSGAVTVGYEEATGGFAGDLSPTDGYWSLSLGATYAVNDSTEITGGVRYVALGDADTEHPLIPGETGAEFRNNHAIGLGLQITTAF